MLIEIQVRTALQDAWAQVFEGLADSWGREIRYGQPMPDPDAPAVITPGTRQEVIRDMFALSEMITTFEEADCRIKEMESMSLGDILGPDEHEALVADLRGQQRRLQEAALRRLQRMMAFQESEEW